MPLPGLSPALLNPLDVAMQVPLSQKDMTVQDAAAKVTPLDKKYKLSVGELKRFKEAAAHFTSDLAAFSRGKGWSDIEALLSQLHVSLEAEQGATHTLRALLRQGLDCHEGAEQAVTLLLPVMFPLMSPAMDARGSAMRICLQRRIEAGTREELVTLMTVPGVQASRARILYNCGILTPEQLAASDPDDIAKNLKSGETVLPRCGCCACHACLGRLQIGSLGYYVKALMSGVPLPCMHTLCATFAWTDVREQLFPPRLPGMHAFCVTLVPEELAERWVRNEIKKSHDHHPVCCGAALSACMTAVYHAELRPSSHHLNL